ncbi:STAS domain-containing protein [Streptomyces griseorubiginosus]|uniref:STAS domain-containing protein n=1 Tax=Streptomyces griseorubiginosus TaxID=67304 RepID=UPI002E813895|nr:STAS domain-containing protein [Streptomyces griseorubiginosus]WUB42117.1 STAS domain-containing protein [Streptomyces griseorubiginosus]WUB50636.1 STAS domain-containing protein [Streptomyces griseorubiginosus]
MSPLNITTRDAATGPVVEIAGELDYANVSALQKRLDALALGPGQRLVLDMRGLEFCDSSGITALLAARSRAETVQADIALAAVPPNMLRVLRIVGLDQIFTIHPDSETATRP